jgi:hypothetical protein
MAGWCPSNKIARGLTGVKSTWSGSRTGVEPLWVTTLLFPSGLTMIEDSGVDGKAPQPDWALKPLAAPG